MSHVELTLPFAATPGAGSVLLDVPVKAEIRIPQSLKEVDNGKILGFGAELSEDHPVRFGMTLVAVCLVGPAGTL